MKNTNSKYTEAIADYIKANPGATLDGIKEGNPKVSHVMVIKALKDLQTENLITASDEDGGYTFVSGKKAANTTEPKVEGKDDKKAEKKGAAKKNEEEDLGPATVTGRDNSKYILNGDTAVLLSKGRLVHAVLKKFISDNQKISIEKIEEMFAGIQPRFGTIRKLECADGARSFSKNKIDRFFLKPSDILQVGIKKEKAAICSQWSVDTIKPFIRVASSLGMKIKVA